MTPHDSTAAHSKRRGYLGCPVGCFGIVGVVVVAAVMILTVLPAWRIGVIRDSIALGMSTEEVIERARGWFVCRAFAGPLDKRTFDFEVWSTRYFETPRSGAQRTYSTRAEMARALAADMKRHDVAWTMTFGYTTNTPNRIYFDVEFSADGRVKRVSDTSWGTLN